MLVLGIETSGLEGSVALLRHETCLAERRLNQVGRRHAQSLVLEIGEMLKEHSLSSRDMELVAVSRGPGSFTGLRVGMVCAKTFAYATGCRFIAVDTFAAIAETAPAEIDRLFIVEDAQRDDLFAGEYLRDGSHQWKQVAPIRIVSVDEFLRSTTSDDSIAGPGVKKLRLAGMSTGLLDLSAATRPLASLIASLGSRDSLRDPADLPSIETDFWRASPFYLRLSAAEEKRASLEKQDDPGSGSV